MGGASQKLQMSMSDRHTVSVDTNVILRHLLNDQPDHSRRASALFLKVRSGEASVFCPDTAIFESVHILTGMAGAPRQEAATALSLLIGPESFVMDHKASVLNALAFWTEQPALDYADCYHLALTRDRGLTQIYTFDKKMNRYPGVERIEP